MKLVKIQPNADPESAAALINVQCSKCKGFSQWNDAAATSWHRDLEGGPFATYYCGVCVHDIVAGQKINKR